MLVALGAILFTSQVSIAPSPHKARTSDTRETNETLQKALTVKQFYEEHREEVLKKVVEDARTDPKYGYTLSRLNEQYIMSLEGFSESQKREMWKRIQDAQNAVRQASSSR